ncbi:MAG: hypothetical protein ABIO56_05610 [Ferruginibacter sp.]
MIIIALSVILGSCLKQSIPDAMLNEQGKGNVTATLSYEVNGNPVNILVPDANNQYTNHTLAVNTYLGVYTLQGKSSTGEIIFSFTNYSLTTGPYTYSGNYGDMYFVNYNGTNEYVHAYSDSLTFNIMSYKNGVISGNFSGRLTPLITTGTNNDIFGTPGSVLITKGSFQNVPVF